MAGQMLHDTESQKVIKSEIMNPVNDEIINQLIADKDAGTVHFQDRRMWILDTAGIGFFRKTLIDTLGLVKASILLYQCGYATGYSHALQVKEENQEEDPETVFKTGLHQSSLFGWGSVDFKSFKVDQEACILEIECEVLNSFDAESHLLYFGKHESHVCSTTSGYFAGFGAALMGCDVFVLEGDCVASGDNCCSFKIKSEFAERDEEIDITKKLMRENGLDYHEVLKNIGEETKSIRHLVNELTAQQEKVKTLETQLFYLQEHERETGEIIGSYPAFKKALQLARTVAASDSTVLITGETGTGKDILARYVHSHGTSSTLPLVVVNCAALPAGLVESELFGHEKGAFTGAVQRKLGKFEIANNSTIFLDEIGELPLETQIKFLRVLQEGEFERLGGTQVLKTNARVIAATNQNLQELVREGKFRADLYYRLNVFPIKIPSLRERGNNDIVELINYFVQKYNRKFRKQIKSINKNSFDRLKSYQFPGNVRELQHLIERAVLLSEGDILAVDLLALEPSKVDVADPVTVIPSSKKQENILTAEQVVTLEEMERRYIERVLQVTNNIIAGKNGAAKILGLNSSTLRSRMKKLGLK